LSFFDPQLQAALKRDQIRCGFIWYGVLLRVADCGLARQPEPEKASQIETGDKSENEQHGAHRQGKMKQKKDQTFVYSAVNITPGLKRLTSGFGKFFFSFDEEKGKRLLIPERIWVGYLRFSRFD
jgi:hypothetical protein